MAAATGAPFGGLNPKPKPNPSANCPGIRSPGKPVALADIVNSGRPCPPRPMADIVNTRRPCPPGPMADILKMNPKLAQLLAQKTKIIELSGIQINKLRVALHTTRQQNLHLAQAHSQITAELNQAKVRLKVLQHELACATAMLKVKASGLERKSSTGNNQLQTEITSQEELKAAPSKFAPIEAHQADNKGNSANLHHSVETKYRPEAPPDKTNKRTSVNTRTSKRRNTVRRRSSRLNPGSCEMAEASCETLHLDEPNSREDMWKAAQDELLCNTAVHIKASVLKKNKINKHLRKEANVQEAHSKITSIEDPEAYQIDNQATNTNPIHPAETQPSLPFNTQQPEPPKERANKRKSPRRKSSRLNPGKPCEVRKGTLGTDQEGIIAPLVPPSSDVVMEHSKDEKQSDSRSSMKPSEEQATGRSSVQATGRRSSMRAAAKVVCYKEIPVNVKMRRP